MPNKRHLPIAAAPRRADSLTAAAATLCLLPLLQSCSTPAPAPSAARSPTANATAATRTPPPTAADGRSHHAMVAAANPLAAQAGLDVLRAGGSAADAAVAIQAVLGLVEPQSSGLGGGAFITYYDARTRSVSAYDGRERAPAGATADMFLGSDGKPLSYGTAVLSGRRDRRARRGGGIGTAAT